MSTKLLLLALERASMEYARTRSPYALERALQLMDTMRDRLTELEEALFDPPVQERREAVTQ